MRHAKSDWSEPNKTDFERGLNTRGTKDALKMCSVIQHFKEKPSHFFCSTAKRARMTIEPFQTHLTFKLSYTDKLYSFTGSDYIQFIKEIPHNYESVLILGHNPSVEYVVTYLLNAKGGSIRIPTSSLLKIVIETESWKEIEAGRGVLHYFLYPKIVGQIV